MQSSPQGKSNKGISINKIPTALRPREKMLARGAETLTNSELLAVLLGSGIPGRNIKDISRMLIAKFGNQLADAGIKELTKTPGIGRVKAMQIVAAFELTKRYTDKETKITIKSAEDAVAFCHNLLSAKHERLMALFLDIRQQLIEKKEISRGTVNGSLIHPREIYGPAVELRASSVILVHNHPSGNPTPSSQDYEITERIAEAGEILGIKLLDHLILAKEGVRSAMKDKKDS